MKEINKSKNKSSSINYRFLQNNHKQNVLLLHGFLGDQHIWDPLLSELSKCFNIITLDLPGHGKTPCEGEILTMGIMADLVLNTINELDLKTFHIVGHSMGGYIGLELLDNYPDRVESLTLLNSTAKNDSEQKKEDRLRAIQVFDHNPKVFIKDAITNLFYEPNIKKLQPEVERLQFIALGTSVNGAKACLRGMRERKNFENLINCTSTPIQYIAGKYDSTVTYDSIIDQIKSDNIRLITMEDSGHMSFAEEPEKTLTSIIDFIDSNENTIYHQAW